MGDHTNFVLMFCGQLLGNAESLLRIGLHPTDIIKGYEMATLETLKILEG